MNAKNTVPVWPMRRVEKKGVAHLAFPFPTGETGFIQVADGVPAEVERIAQDCIRAQAKTWARKTFPAAFAGI